MGAYMLEWAGLLVRWFHFVAGVAWIGTSFYFVWLDNHLIPPLKRADHARGVSGELWSVHGGGFYHNQKFLTGPTDEPLSEDLHWFKWEAYSTWISGMLMLALVYWIGAGTFLVDRNVLDLMPSAAVAISAGVLLAGWFVYDGLCRALASRPVLLGAVIYAALVASSWALFHIFSARAAYIHIGSIIGTIMVANVFLVIIPGQRKMLAQIRAGQKPDPRPGVAAKMRSVHNTYFTLPVLFIMISNHYPMTYSTAYGWLVLAAIGLAGVLVRHFFILTHKGHTVPALPIAAGIVLAAAAIAIAPHPQHPARSAVGLSLVQPIFAQRCAVCHSAHPTQPGFANPPAGVLLDSPAHISANVQRIYQQVVATNAMPLGNVTGMTSRERELVGAWIAGGAGVP